MTQANEVDLCVFSSRFCGSIAILLSHLLTNDCGAPWETVTTPYFACRTIINKTMRAGYSKDVDDAAPAAQDRRLLLRLSAARGLCVLYRGLDLVRGSRLARTQPATP